MKLFLLKGCAAILMLLLSVPSFANPMPPLQQGGAPSSPVSMPPAPAMPTADVAALPMPSLPAVDAPEAPAMPELPTPPQPISAAPEIATAEMPEVSSAAPISEQVQAVPQMNPSRDGEADVASIPPAPSPLAIQQNTPEVTPTAPAETAEEAVLPEPSVGEVVQPPYIGDKAIKIATGAVEGIYYPAGEAICRVINRDRKNMNLRCDAEPTTGSVYNLKALSDAKVHFALVQSDWQKKSYTGESIFKDEAKAFENMRFMFSLYNEALTIIVKKNSPITSLNDLVHKSVNFGPEGSGVRAMMNVIMGIKGWTNNSFSTILSLNPDSQPDALCNGNMDVMIAVIGHPNDIVRKVSNMCEIRILNLANDPDVQKLVRENPEYSAATINAGLYSGVPQEVSTFGVKATLVTTTEMSDDLVYKITKAIFSDLSYFKKLNPAFVNLSAEKMVEEGQTAPMHAGAAKYFREAGYIK